MGLFDFVKEAGEKLFGGEDDSDKGSTEVVRTPEMALADKRKGEALANIIGSVGLEVEGLNVKYFDGLVTLKGKAASQEVKEKIILLAGNTQGVSRVEDKLDVGRTEPEALMYTVKAGDSLSKIAKAHYGDAMKYMTIFEANTPMLKDPDKIYPGQTLRIPPLEK
jgi:nucleoid-associated protein YgaU